MMCFRRVGLLLLLALLLAACATAPPAPVATPVLAPTESPWRLGTPSPLFAPLRPECLGAGRFPPRLDHPRYGIKVFLFATDRERVLALTEIGGFQWVRQQIHWRDLEGEQGQFVWEPLDEIVEAARARNLQLLLSVVRSPEWATADGRDGLPDDPQDLAIFLREVATRYRGRVAAYQVWNEPNLAHEGGGVPIDPADYLAALRASYQAIKEADPCALVVSAAMAATHNPDPAVASEDLPFFEQLYTLEDGAFLAAADIVGSHTGAGSHPPDALWPANAPEQSHHYFRHIERVRDIMQRHNDPRQVWITEYGWTVTTAEGAPQPVSERQQADYMVDALWRVRQRYPWISGMFVWNLNFSVIAPPEDEKTTYSILAPDWSIRPAFLSLQNNVGALRDIQRAPFVPATAPYTYTWTFPGRGQMRSAPQVMPDGTVLVVSDPGTLYAVGPAGRLHWDFVASGSVAAPPARSPEGGLFLGDSGSLLHAIGADGTPRWQARLDSPLRGTPLYVDDRVVAVSQVGTVYAFALDAEKLWEYDLGSPSTAPVLSSDGAILVMDGTGRATKLDTDGRVIWSVLHNESYWSAPVPDAAGGLYVVTVAGRVLALDGNGQQRWLYDLDAPVIAPPLAGADGRLYVAARDGRLLALDASSGALLWEYATGSDLLAPPMQGTDGTLFLGTGDERLLAIGPDGSLLWQVQLRGQIEAQPAIGPDGTLYVPTRSGRLYAFAPR